VTAHRSQQLHDPGAELLDQATNMWGSYGRIVLIVVGVLVAAGGLAYFGLRARAKAEDAAANRLADANLLFWQGEYKRSTDVAQLVGEQWPGTPSGKDSHRLAGDDAFWVGDFKTAISEYRTALNGAKPGLLTDAVKRSLAAALECDKQYPEAITLYTGLIGKFDRESSADCLEAAARCESEAGHPAEAVKYLQRLVDEYGETTRANPARVRIAELTATSR
jgi:tetratricopeptide (TPR) repeat protein